jgi:hypothetical protein
MTEFPAEKHLANIKRNISLMLDALYEDARRTAQVIQGRLSEGIKDMREAGNAIDDMDTIGYTEVPGMTITALRADDEDSVIAMCLSIVNLQMMCMGIADGTLQTIHDDDVGPDTVIWGEDKEKPDRWRN